MIAILWGIRFSTSLYGRVVIVAFVANEKPYPTKSS